MLVRSEMTAQLFSPSSYTYIFNLPIWKPFLNLSIGAGSGLLLTYATYMSRRNSVVKLGILLPVCNNLIRWTQLTSFVRCVVYRLGDVKCNSLEILVARKVKLQEICYFNGLSHESQTTWIAHFFLIINPCWFQFWFLLSVFWVVLKRRNYIKNTPKQFNFHKWRKIKSRGKNEKLYTGTSNVTLGSCGTRTKYLFSVKLCVLLVYRLCNILLDTKSF